MDTIIDLFVSTGLGSPFSRAIAFGAAGFGAQYFIKPSVSYTTMPAGRNGQTKQVAKDFSLSATCSTPSTWFPWFFWPLLFAAIGGLFI